MTHRSVRRCIAPRPVGCCTDSRPESRGPIHRAQAKRRPVLAENHNNAASSMSRHARQVLTVAQGKIRRRPCDRSVHRPLLAGCLEQHHLDPGQPMAPMVLEHARMLERRERLHRCWRSPMARCTASTSSFPATTTRYCSPMPAGDPHCVNADAQRQTSNTPASGSAPTGASLRRHQRHRHLRGRAAGPDHPAGRALP